MLRAVTLITFSLIYWAFAAFVIALASIAPCGLAPGAWCEQEGPGWFGATLGFLGPLGVLMLALVIYAGVLMLNTRKRKTN